MARKDSKLTLAQKEQRTAYRLLIPALVILAAVAFYPLFEVFYTSFTNRVFASGTDEAPDFIGIENYKSLLGLTIQEMPPVIDTETGQPQTDASGKAVYERAVRVLPRTPVRYREWFQFSFFGKRYVVGARDPEFMKAIWNTLVFTVVSVFLETILGLGVALVVNSNFKGRGVMRATMLVPWAVITVVSARIWEWMLQPTRAGLFNMVLNRLGLGDGSLSFLSSPALQMPTLIAVDVWKTTPFMALLLLAGLQLIPRELYEAGRVDGASKFRQFFSITLPLLKPTLAVALIFRTLDALRAFDVFQVLMGNRMYSMATYNYYQLIGNRNMGLASAIGVIIFIFIAVFAVIYMRFMGVDKE
ncbi:MAG TPA: sugar ABC transporter permease [Mesotoga sp.]|jgi:trehalose/maltose transport system permease protein|nr:sugar ABC transporter permease [Mesotoga sp.]MDI9375142.1 sugar ABC transporter permease [Thermotogota bacterium]NLX33600.1 sugar ABC transporter permease [Thermotogaceae bacterium]MDD4039641.1 sugar ABC transporter permease [Mesotoga sp.]MDD4478215.1 sugar ABC transporter permease [Mesotoga sp.]